MMFGFPLICDCAVDDDLRLTAEKLSFLQATEKRTNKTVMKKKQKTSFADAWRERAGAAAASRDAGRV